MKKLKSIVMGMFLILAAAVPVFAVDGVNSKISGNDNEFRDNNPTIWENIAVFTRGGAAGGSFYGLYMYDTRKGIFSALSTTGDLTGINGAGKNFSVYANRVAYKSTSGIKVLDIDTSAEHLVVADTTASHPSIYGDRLAYTKNSTVYLKNLLDGNEIQVSATGSAYLQGEATGTDMYGENVAWLERDQYTYDYSLHIYSITTGQTRIITIGSDSSGRFDLFENYIVWNTSMGNNGVVYGYDLLTGTTPFPISDPLEGGWFVSINNYKVVWDTNGQQWIGVYDLKTEVRSKVSASGAQPYCPVTDGDKILYSGHYDGYWMIDITSPREEAYSLNTTANTVTVISPYRTDDPTTTEDDRIVATIPTGAGPSDTALSPDETKLYILNSTAKTVTVAQTYDFVPVYTVNINPTNKQTATAVAGDNDSNTYVALKNSSGAGVVKKITSTGIETTLTVGTNPNGLKISPDNKKLLVSNGSSSNVTAIDLATFSIIEGNIATGGGPKIVRP